jgi:N-acetylglucosamine kinase-like BadF-type ATPase
VRILKQAAKALSRFLHAVCSQLFSREERPTLSYIGGVFQSSTFKAAFLEEVEHRIDAVVQPPLYSAAAGAALQALRADGNSRPLANVPES